MTISYDSDFVGWTREQAALLRAFPAGSGLDTENLAEEIEASGRLAIRELAEQLRLTLTNIVTLSWSAGVIGSPHEAINAQSEANLKGEQGVSRHVDLQSAWNLAGQAAMHDLQSNDYDEPILPETCPLTLHQLLADDFDVNAAVLIVRDVIEQERDKDGQ